ncbi:MAG: response regulator [Candidatus Saganbacteria bacterium]|nr:response regulator [Candidatus Saganbacteria bacterium]
MKKKILMVDDDNDFLSFTKVLLERNNYEVLSALSGEAALKIVETNLPDLIFLDITMKEMDGYAVALQLKTKEETKNIPIIMLTGKKDSESISRSLDLNVADYIMKPFDNQDLLGKIKKLIG